MNTTAEDNERRLPVVPITILGLVTIASYGTWYYAFGVLLDPLLADTGWPERWVTGSFAVSVALGGLAAPVAGRLLDRVASRWLFATAAVLSTAGFGLASSTDALAVFVASSIVGGAALSALGFYHVTQTTAVRISPGVTAKAIALLTIYGAFASTIYLPLAAALVEAGTWRTTLRVLTALTAVILVVAAVFIRDDPPGKSTRQLPSFTATLSHPVVRRYAVATVGVGVASGIILVYQVPLMTEAGLPLATASWFAGARGAAQLGGRLPLHLLVNRIGVQGSLQLAFAAITVGVLLLAGAGSVMIALLFVLVAGFGIGATSPLQGLYANELADPRQLGQFMGTISMIFGVSGALGPAAVGILADATGNRWWGILIGAVGAAGATVLMILPSPVGDAASARR